MANKPKKPKPTPTPAPPADGSSGGKPKPARTGTPLGVYISPELFAAFDRFIAAHKPRTSKTAIVEQLLEEFLEREGYWPSDDKEGE